MRDPLPPELSRLGDQLHAAAERTLAARRRRRAARLAALACAAAVALVALTWQTIEPGERGSGAGAIRFAALSPGRDGCDAQPRGARFSRPQACTASALGRMVLVRPYSVR